MTLAVLTWNLMHGRAQPAAARDLFEHFAARLTAWDWEVALLQEVPPWWPPDLAARLRAQACTVLTSRNSVLPVRRRIAQRWPDLIKSNGGGSNAILVRSHAIAEHRLLRLRTWPERRWLHAVRLERGVWLGNLHLSVHDDHAARQEAAKAAQQLSAWALGAPAILAGDFNVRKLQLEGFEYLGGNDVDHIYGSRATAAEPAEAANRGTLSDHAPVLMRVRCYVP